MHAGRAVNLLIGFMYAAIVLDHAHLACPIALGWGNPRFRAHMLRQWEKFILLPALCVLIPLAIGGTVETTRDPVFRAMAATYFVFNTWHFASQNWGLSALAGGRPGQCHAAFALTAICLLALPMLWGQLLWIVLADLGISLMHWIMDLRLSSYVAWNQWLFTAGMLAIGLSGFVWKRVGFGPHLCGPMMACTAALSIPVLMSLRYGLGFWHFLMSRWVWSRVGQKLMA